MPDKITVALVVALATSATSLAGAGRDSHRCPDPAPIVGTPDSVPLIQLALLLDTSNSMDGLIDQARSQLWKTVNELSVARRHHRPARLEVALYEYGNSRLSPTSGYVRRILPFTSDLDRVSEELFALSTQGGDEYCGTVIQTALDELRWSRSADLKVIFIAGNEPFTQGPVDFRKVSRRAQAEGIVVNTIHCGPREEGELTGWREGARLASGSFAAIDHKRAVAHIAAPQDDEIARLGEKLNQTYLPYGASGLEGQARQITQDENAKRWAGSATQRAVTKANAHYLNSRWDLVDAVKNAEVDLKKMKEADLPQGMRQLGAAEREAFVAAKAKERERLQALIQRLHAARTKYVAQAQTNMKSGAGDSLDAVMAEALRDQASCRGITLR